MPESHLTTTSASLSRRFGLWQEKAMSQPVMVTHHGRPRAVLVSIEQFERFEAEHGEVEAAQTEPAESGILDMISQAFIALDRDLVIRRVNHAAVAHVDQPPSAIIGRTLEALYPALRDTTRMRMFARVLRTGERVSFEVPSHLHPHQMLRVDAFPYGDGVGFLFQPITDTELRQQVAENEALKALCAAHGATGTARVSLRGTIIRIDEPLLAMAGMEDARLRSHPLSELVVPEDRPALDEALESVLDGQGAIALSVRIGSSDGSITPATMALAETQGMFAIDGATILVTPRAG